MNYKEFRVIEIVDDITLLINYGLDNGAHTGDTLRIIQKGEPVIAEGVNYGTLDIVKDVVEVITPYKAFSVCRKIVRRHYNPLNPLENMQRTITKLTPLNVDPKDMTHRTIDDNKLLIKKNDIAVLTNA